MVGVVGFEPTITWSQIKWINQTLLHSVYLIKKKIKTHALMDLNHLIISLTVKIFYPFKICSYESFKKSNCQRTKTQLFSFVLIKCQLLVIAVCVFQMEPAEGVEPPNLTGLLTKQVLLTTQQNRQKWDLRENQEHTISNMLYRLQRRENLLVDRTRAARAQWCLQSTRVCWFTTGPKNLKTRRVSTSLRKKFEETCLVI